LLALAALAPRAHAAPAAVDAVIPLASGVRFRVHVPEPRLVPVPGTAFTRLELEGFEPGTPPGAPSLPARVVHVAVPAQGDVEVRVTAAATRAFEGVRLAPTPEPIERGSTAAAGALVPRRSAYAGPAGSATPGRLLGVSWLRNQRVASIAIEPARWDPATGRLVVATDVTVEVSGQPGAPAGALAEAQDPFERVYRDLLLNYDQGRAWRRPAIPGPRSRAALGARLNAVAEVRDTSVFAGRRWVKLAIPASGFYKVTFGQLRNTAVFNNDTTTPLDSLRLFTWPGVPVLPENNFCDSCDYREAAIAFVDKQGNGVFDDNEDYFYFYALGPNDWIDVFDPARPDTVYLNHPYETHNFYYLTVATSTAPMGGVPARIGVQSAPPAGGVTPATFRERLHFETDAEYFPDATPLFPSPLRPSSYFWEKWFWRSMDTGRSFGDVFDAPGADTAQGVRVRVRLWGLATRDTCISDRSLASHMADFFWGGVAVRRYAWDELRGFTIDTTLAGLRRRGNDVLVQVPAFPLCPSRIDRIGFAWYDVFYRRRFEPVGNELTFETPDSAADYLFQVAPFTTDTLPRLFDVTDAYHPVELVDFHYASDTLAFEQTQAGRRRYAIVQDASIQKLAAANIADAPAASLVNLRSASRHADYLVIFYDGFRQAADELTAWRRMHDGFETDSVPVSALYDQFSGGRTDPTAIRNFLRATATSWNKKPTFVTLLGDASFDFKNLTGRAPAGQPGTLLPSYEGGFDTVVLRQFATDDWLLNIDNPSVVVPDFFGGRIPVGDAAAALDVVRNKIILYERGAPLGEYRNRVMLIADDNYQGPLEDGLDFLHLEQTSILDSVYTAPHMDRVYVYLHTYPTEAGYTKPAAKADIKNNINNGVAMFNYIGHGSPFKLSDESVFLDTDVGTLTNTTRLPIFVAASCDIGKFNDPTVQSLGERLLITPGRGAIAVVSATELALSSQNAALNQVLYGELFRRGADGQYDETVSEALLGAKSGSLNSQKYELIGDAATRPNLPRLWVNITLHDSAGTDTIRTSLDRGRTLTFRGQVVDRPGGSPVAFDGVASMLIEDSAPLLDTPPCSFCAHNPKFYFKAGAIFRGDVAMHGGAFQGRFVVPLEARTGARARVRAYVQTSAAAVQGQDGVGSLRLQLNPGDAGTSDRTGPRITLSFPSGSSAVKPDAVLRIDLFDPSGILTTGHTPQNGIIVTLDGNTTGRVDVTSSFRYAADSYQSGTASFQLPNLPEGAHTVDVSAADNLASGLGAAAHRSRATLAYQVVEQPRLRVARAYLFPNPTLSGGPRGGGRFVIEAPGDSVNVLLRLYTVSGRLIRTLRYFGGLGQVQIPWDGLDDEGSRLANGVYLFKVHVNPRAADGTSSPQQKAEADGRFVIVNR